MGKAGYCITEWETLATTIAKAKGFDVCGSKRKLYQKKGSRNKLVVVTVFLY